MQDILQTIFTGLSTGVLYGVVGIGYVLIHRMTGMVNFAQGSIVTCGAFGTVVAAQYLPPWLALFAGALTGVVVSLLVGFVAVHLLRKHTLLVQTIATLGAGIVIDAVLQLIFGTSPRAAAPITEGGPLTIFGASLSYQTLWMLLAAVLIYAGSKWFFDRTLLGNALAACSVNRYAAQLMGINVVKMTAITFIIGGAVTGLMGGAQAPISFAVVGGGLAIGLKGFIAAILGGFDKIGLALVGGLVVGVAEAAVARAVSASYQEVIVYALLVVLLIVRPSGFVRKKVTERV